MLEEESHCSPFSPSAFRAPLQTSIFQASNRTTGAAVSLIKKADVKNHLSTRHRNEIHLYRPEDDPKAAGLVEGESARAGSKFDEPVQSALNPLIPSGPEAAPTA